MTNSTFIATSNNPSWKDVLEPSKSPQEDNKGCPLKRVLSGRKWSRSIRESVWASGERDRAQSKSSLWKGCWRWDSQRDSRSEGQRKPQSSMSAKQRGIQVIGRDWTGRSRARRRQESLMEGFQCEGMGEER